MSDAIMKYILVLTDDDNPAELKIGTSNITDISHRISEQYEKTFLKRKKKKTKFIKYITLTDSIYNLNKIKDFSWFEENNLRNNSDIVVCIIDCNSLDNYLIDVMILRTHLFPSPPFRPIAYFITPYNDLPNRNDLENIISTRFKFGCATLSSDNLRACFHAISNHYLTINNAWEKYKYIEGDENKEIYEDNASLHFEQIWRAIYPESWEDYNNEEN